MESGQAEQQQPLQPLSVTNEYDRLEEASIRREFEKDLVQIADEASKWVSSRVLNENEAAGELWIVTSSAASRLWSISASEVKGDALWCAKRLNRLIGARLGPERRVGRLIVSYGGVTRPVYSSGDRGNSIRTSCVSGVG